MAGIAARYGDTYRGYDDPAAPNRSGTDTGR